jgi:ABC-type dipeptide/oligopeptide/nickel transport system permease subunit
VNAADELAPWRRALRRFMANRAAVAGAVIVLLVIGGALVGPALDAHGPLHKDVAHGLTELGAPLPPSAEFPLGTDALGRCVLARVLDGARVSLEVGIVATLIALVIGVGVGLVAGYSGGATDAALMRLVDLILAFPFLLLVIALAAIFRDSGMTAVLVVLGIVGWTTMGRVIRAKVLAIRETEYVQGARAVGSATPRVLLRHILPNVMGPIVVLATISVAQMILAESTLTYLGLGAPPPQPTWGRMLSEGVPWVGGAPWLVFVPGVAVLLTVLGFNLLGEGLRDALDPKDRR